MKVSLHFLIVLLALGGGCAERDPSAIKRSGSWDSKSELARELTALNDELTQAYENEEVTRLRELLSDSHVHNNVFGSRMDRETFLSDIESGILEFVTYKTPEIDWFLQGDTAIATGLIEAKAIRNGQPVPAETFRFTRIFVREGGDWKVLLFHNTMTGKPPAN